MSACCPACSAPALGTESLSLCTECATATVAGASFNLPLLIALTIGAGATVLALRWARRRPMSFATTPRVLPA